MAIYRVNKAKDYTTIANFHLREKDMTLKAKGLLTLYLSLPDSWDFSAEGIASLCIEHKQTINKINQELERFRYLKRTRLTDEKGRFKDWRYDIYEKPHTNYPQVEKPLTVNSPQLNTKKLNTNINNKENINKRKIFIKPKLEEVKTYCQERKNKIDPQNFIDYYETNGWMVGRNKMKDWKACIRTWEARQKKDKPYKQKQVIEQKVPEWYDKEIEIKQASADEELKMKAMLSEFEEEENE